MRRLLAFVAVLLAIAAPAARAEVYYGIEATQIYSVDTATGGPATSLVTFGAPLAFAATLAVRPSDGALFYLDSGAANPNLWRWDPSTPSVPPVLLGTPGVTTTNVIRLVFDTAGVLYAMNSGAGATLWTLDQNSGAILTATPTSGAVTPGGGDICVHPTTGVMYMVASTNLYTITPAGVVTLIGAVTGLPGAMTGCAFDRAGNLVTSPSATLYRVNVSTLVATAMPSPTGVTAWGDLGTAPWRTADVSLTKTASNLTPGNTVSFTITVTNAGPDRNTDVRVTDLLPAGTTFVSSTVSQGTYTSGTGLWRVGPLNAGASATLTINASVTTAGNKINTAQVIYADNFDPDSTPNNNAAGEDDQASVTITPSPDLQIAKTANATFAIGVNGVYTISVNNTLGSVPTAGVYTVTDVLPAGLTFVSGTGTGWTCGAVGQTVTCTSSTIIAAGAANPNNITLTVAVAAGAVPSVTNTATIAGGGEPASNNGNNSATNVNQVCAASCPDVRVVKAGPASFTVGVNGTYTLSANNISGGIATTASYTITDPLPTGMTLAAVPTGTGWTCAANTPLAGDNIIGGGRVVCTSATVIAAGGSNPNAITVTVAVAPGAAPSASNTASIAGGGEPAGNTGNNSTTLVTPVNSMDFRVTKTSPATFSLGVNGAYTITVTNAGAAATSGTYTVADNLPAGLTFVSAAGTGWTCAANTPAAGDNVVGGTRMVCTRATAIAAGASAPAITLTVAVAAAAAPSVSNTASVSHPSEPPLLAGDNASTVVTPVNAPDLIVTKTHNFNFSVGTNGQYFITAHNIGDQTTAGTITIADNLPTGMTFVSAAGTGWTCAANTPAAGDNVVGGTRMVCTRGTAIAANASGPGIILTVAVGAAAAPSQTNTAAVSGGNEPANNNTNNTDSDFTQVFNAPTATKTFNPTSITAGGSSQLTLTITNTAGAPITGVGITDSFPAGMSIAGTPAFSSTCGGTVSPGQTAGDTAIILAGGTIAASSSCTIQVNVTSTTIGNSVNTTGNVTSTEAGTGGNAAATLTITAPANAVLTKLSSPATVGVNRDATLTFTIANDPTTSNNMAFTDTFPAGVFYQNTVSITNCGGSVDSFDHLGGALATGDVGVRFADLDLAASATCIIVINVRSASAGTYRNFGPAAGGTNISGLAGGLQENVDDTLTVVAPTLTKAFSPNPAIVSTNSTLTFTITNGAGNPAQGPLAFTDTLPLGLVVATPPAAAQCNGTVTTDTGGAGGAHRIILTNGSLAGGQASCTVAVDVTSATIGTTYTNNAASMSGLSAGMVNSVNASIVFYSVPVLTKAFSPATIASGGATTLTFTLTVPANNPTQTFSFTDTLPAGLAVGAGAVGGTCTGGSVTATAGTNTITVAGRQIVNPATTCTITVPVTTSGTPTIGGCPAANNTNGSAAITATTNITNSVTDQCVTVYAPATLTKSFVPSTIGVGQTSALRLTLTNPAANAAALTGVSVSDPLGTFNLSVATPASVTFTPAACGTVQSRAAVGAGVYGALTAGHLEIQFDVASLAPGASCQADVNVTSTTLGAAANVTAAPTATGPVALTGTAANATLTVVQPTLTKAFGAASINDAATTTLVFTLTNGAGDPAQSGIGFTDTLPTGLAINSATPALAYSAGCSGAATGTYVAGTRVLTLSGIDMAAATASCTVTVSGVTNQATQVNASCAGNPAAFTNGSAAIGGLTRVTNGVTDQCLVVTRVNANVAKTFGAASINDGAATTLVFTLTNTGSNPAQSGIDLGDTLPTGLRLNSATPAVAYSAGCAGPATAAYNGGTRVLSGITGVTMASGTASCTVTVSGLTNQTTQVNASCAGNPAAFTNLAASVTTANATNTSTDQCLVVNRINPNVAKTFGAASINDSATTTLVFTLTNQGTNPAQSGIDLGDTLPTGLQLGSATPALAYSAGCAGPATASYNAGTRVLSGITGVTMASGTASCTVTVSGLTNQATQTNASCAGNPAAFTNLAASVTASGASNTSTDQCLVVNVVSPNVAKTFGSASINDGASTTLVFTLTNSGSNPAQSGIAVGDTLPTGLRLNSVTPAVAYSAGCAGPAAGSYNAGTRVLSGITGVTMASGTASCTVTVSGLTNQATQVNASCAGNPAAFTNLAASVTSTNATNTSTDQCVVVNRINPNVAKTFGAASINDNATTTLVFTLTNQGTNPAQAGIDLGDTLPTGLRLNSATPAIGYSAGCSGPATAAYNAGTRVLSGLTGVAMASGTASCTVTVSGLTNQATQVNASCAGNPTAFTNLSASVTATNAANTSTDQCLVVNTVNASVAKTFGSASINDAASTTLVFTLTNSGSNPAQSGIAVGDTLPTGLQLNSATPAVAYSAGCAGPATGSYNSGTRVLSGVTGVTMASGTASCTITVSGLTNQATQVNASCAGNPAAFTNLAASVTTANASNTSTDQCVVVNRINPNVAKTFGAASINDSATTTLVFTLTNQGTNPAQSGIAVGDTLPTGLQLNSATPAVAYSAGCAGPANGSYNAGTRVLSGITGVTMASGTASCTVTVSGLTNQATQVNASCVGNPAAFTNTSAAVTTTNATNTSSDQCLVVNTVNASVAKTFGAASINDGASTTLVFTLTNSGSSPAQSGIAVGDTLPTGLQMSSATPAVAYSAGCAGPANGAYNAGTRVLSGISGVTMASGTASCTITVSGLTNQSTQVNASCAGNPAAFTNLTGSVTTTNASNTSTDQCLVVNRINPNVAKTFGAASINDNATTTLVFTLTNQGTNPAQSGIAVGDTLPTGLRLNSVTPAVAYSAGCAGPATGSYNAGTRVLSGITGVTMASGTASCTITVSGLTNQAAQVNASCAGNPAAFTNLSASVTATNATNTSTDQCLVVNTVSASAAKTFGAASINDGASTTLVFTLTNSGSNPAQSGIAVGDTLPTGLQLSSATPAVAYSAGCAGPATGSYNAGTRVLSGITGVTMASGTASCTVTVSGLTNQATQVNASCAGNPAAFTNLAASVTTTNLTNGSTDQCLVVNRINANVAKTFGSASIADNAATTLIFTLSNQGTNPAQSGIAVGDTLPTGLRLNSATPAVAYSAGCAGPAIGAYNAGTRVLSGITGVTMSAGTASCTITVSGLTNQATQTNASCVGNPAAFTNLAASVTSTNAANTSTDQCLVVTAANASVAKTFGSAAINDSATTTLVFTLTNSGSNPAQSGIAVGDTLPTGLQLNSATPAVAYSAGCAGPATAAYNGGTRVLSGITGVTMSSGTASCTITVSGLTNQATQVNASCAGNPAAFTNLTGSVTTTNATNTSTDQCLVVNRINPNVAKTFGSASIADNATTTLVFTLTNQGTNPAQSGIDLGDTLPTGLRLNSATPAVAYSAGCAGPATAAYNSGTRVLSGITGVTMASGTPSCTVTVSGLTNQAGQVNASCVGNPAAFTNLAASVTATGATNTSTNQCLTVNAGSPNVAKTFGAASFNDGASTTLVFTLTNTGSNPAQAGIAVGDTLPTGLQLSSATPAVAYSAGCAGPANGAYNAGTRVLSGITGVTMANGTASCTITVSGLTNQATQVNSSCAGNPAAFTNAAASVTSTNANNTSTDQCVVVNRINPNAAKTFGAASINDGASTTLVFTLTNQGTNPAQAGISLGDTLPTGLQLNSATPAVAYSAGCAGPATASYNAGTRVLSGITGVTMASGTASCTVTVSGLTNQSTQVNASCAGNPAAFTNLGASVTTTSATNTSTDQCLVVNRLNPNVAKTFGAASIADNATTTLVFTLTNQGTNPAQSGIDLGDTLPTGLRLNSVTPAVAYSAGCAGAATATYNVGTRVLSGITGVTMASGTASCTVTVSGLTNQAGQVNASCAGNPAAFTNLSASVTATGAANTSTDQCLVVNAGSPNVAKTFGAASINDGASTTLVFTLTNTGSNPAQSGIAVGDTLPTGLQLNSATPAVAYSAGCSGPATASYNAGTRVLSGITGVTMANGTASCTVTVAGLTNQATQVNASCAGNPAAFTNLAASVTTTNANNTSTDQCVVVNRINPNVAKTFGSASINDNATTTLVFTLTNQGTNPAQSGIAVGDTLPTGLQLNSATPAVVYSAGCAGPATGSYNAGTRVLSGITGVTMSSGTASCTITVSGLTNQATQVNASCAGNPAAFTNAAAAVTTTNATNTSTDQCLVVTTVNASVAKTFGSASIADGASTTLVFTLTNSGSNPAQAGIAVGDTLPTGLQLNSATPAIAYSAGCAGPATGAYNAGARVLSGITGVTMASGTASCTITVSGLTNQATQVSASCAGNPAAFTNLAASVTATNLTNASTDQCLVVNRANANLTKAFSPTTIDQGGTSTLIFTLANTGTNPAQSGINFTDTLPANVLVHATPNVQSNCPAGGALGAAPFVSTGANSITVTGAALNAGVASCEVRVNVTSNTAGTYNNTNAANISATANVNTAGVTATLTVQSNPVLTKAFGSAEVGIGQTTTLAFTIDNTAAGSVNRAGLSFTDTLPAGLETANPPAATASAGCQAPTLTGTTDGSTAIGTSSVGVNAGQSCVITFTVRGTTLGSKTNNAASITAIAGLANAITPQTVTVVQPSVAKTFGAASINAGGTTTLVFTLTNGAGNPAQAGIALGDTLPSGLRFNSATPAVAYGAGCSGPANAAYNSGTRVLSGLTGLAMTAGTASCTVTVSGLTDEPGQTGACPVAAQTNLAANVTTTRATNASTNQCLSIAGAPTLTKAFGAASVGVGQTATLVFTIANTSAGAVNRTGLSFTDTLPVEINIANPPVPATNGQCGTPAFTAANATQPFTAASIDVNAGQTCTITVTIRGVTAGTATNGAANVTAISGLTNNVTNQSITVVAAPTVAKAFAPASIAADGTSTITFTLSNSNAATALTGASFTDALANMSINANQAAGGTCAGAGSNNFTAGQTALSFTGLTIPAASSCTVTIVITSDVAGVHPNQASGIASNQAPTGPPSNTANLTVTAAVPTIAKAFAPASIAIGATSTITLTLASTNGIALTGASFTDTLTNMSINANQAAGGTCAGAGGNNFTAGQTALSFTGLTIPANGSCTVTVVVTSNLVGTHPNQTSGVASNEAATGAASNSASLTVTATAPTITKTFAPATISSGGVSTLTVTIGNANAVAITVSSVTDTFPGGVVRAGTPAASTTCAGGAVGHTAGSVTLTGGSVPAGGSCTFQIDVTAATTGSYLNTIPVGALTTTAGANTVAANATLTVNPVANVSIVKAGPATIATGGTITYTLTISNAGPDAANGTTFSDNVPGAVTGVTGGCGGAAGGAVCGAVNVAGNAVTGTVTTLPSGGSVQITIQGTATGMSSITNTATATVPGGITDPSNANNSSSVVTAILAPDLTLTKTHAGNFTVGVNGVYTLTAQNTGGTLATSGVITVVDTLPVGLTFVSGTGTGWTCGAAGQVVTCTSSTVIAAGASGNAITLTVGVASTAIPSVTNLASVSGGGEPASVANNNQASDNTIVVAAAVNTFAPDNAQTAAPGTTVSYAHTFNAGLAGNVTFSTSAVQTPAGPGWTQQIHRDTNCNGVLDGAEGAAPIGGPIAVNPGDQVCIVVRDNIPLAAPFNAQNVISVTATFNGAQTYTRTDTTTVSGAGAGLTLAKEVRNVTQGGAGATTGSARPNDVLEYTITYTNTSNGPISSIVVSDATPSFTLYQAALCGALPPGVTACNVTTQPAVNGTGAVVWTLTGSLLSGASGTVSFTVRVQP